MVLSKEKEIAHKNLINHGKLKTCKNDVKSISIKEYLCCLISSVAQLCLTLCDPMNPSTPGLPVHHQLLESTKPMSIESVIPSNHLIICRPLPFLPSIFPSIRVFSNESALYIRWPKDWSFSFNISPSNEYPGLISFRIDWLDLLTVQLSSIHDYWKNHSFK